MISKQFSPKTIGEIFKIIQGNIVDLKDGSGNSIKIDAIVNAAKPTLMGGGGVDGLIHKKMDELIGKMDDEVKKKIFIEGNCDFNCLIKKELGEDENSSEYKIRCKPGQAVITRGDGEWVKYVIHAVGSKYDGGSECIRLLEECYENIMRIIFEHGDIYCVAIPVISSGNYNCPFDLALRVAIATIGNCLIREKERNIDNFSRLESIYLVIYEEKYHDEVNSIYSKFEEQILKEEPMSACGQWEKQKAYCTEIIKNDSKKRGFFTITKMFRLFLVIVRILFPLSMWESKKLGKHKWKRRQETFEVKTIVTTIIPIASIIFLQYLQEYFGEQLMKEKKWILYIVCVIVIYFMIDTITYLISLIFLNDIYDPSVNRQRMIILLIFDYVQIVCSFGLFYYIYHWNTIEIWQALDYSILGKTVNDNELMTVPLRLISYSKAGIEFFFAVFIFSFFVSHLKQREYMEDK